MKAPFALPVIVDGRAIYSQDGEPVAAWLAAAPGPKRVYIVNAINLHERMAGAIVELRDATDAEINTRSAHRAVYHPTLERLLAAKEAVTQLANELSTQKE